MSIPQSYFTPAYSYKTPRFNPIYAAPQYPFEDAQEAVHFGAPPQKPSLLKKVLKGALLSGGLVLGGLAFKRYCPGLAAQVAGFIPGFIKNPFNNLAASGVVKQLGQCAQSALNLCQGLFNTVKGCLGGLFSKAA